MNLALMLAPTVSLWCSSVEREGVVPCLLGCACGLTEVQVERALLLLLCFPITTPLTAEHQQVERRDQTTVLPLSFTNKVCGVGHDSLCTATGSLASCC